MAEPDLAARTVDHASSQPVESRSTLEAALAARGEFELFACDPALADTAAFCAAYGFALADSANTIVVVGKSTPPVYAACVVLATHRVDVKHAVRDRLATRKASFASPDETRDLTGRQVGGVTAFGLPNGIPPRRRCGDGPPADRPGRRQPELEGDRAFVDPAHAAQRRGRGRACEPCAAPGESAAGMRLTRSPRNPPEVLPATSPLGGWASRPACRMLMSASSDPFEDRTRLMSDSGRNGARRAFPKSRARKLGALTWTATH